MKKGLLICLLLVLSLFSIEAMAQRTVSGTVTDPETGEAIPGVTVLVQGTSIGTATDVNGKYTLDVPNDDSILEFSGVGLTKQVVRVAAQSLVDVSMATDATELQDVVVTAIGIERDKRSLSYSTQELKSELLEQKGTNNVLSAMQGKIAGVQITGSSGSPGASTNINIRGISSFTGSNQPLFVVDGIPVSNDNEAFGNTLFSTQSSNRISDINPDMIESVNILKGPAAASLYGSRAAAGAVIITTKAAYRSTKTKKNEITYNGSVLVQNVYGLPKYQNDYGQGTLNIYDSQSTNSWGPRFGATPTTVNSLVYGDLPYQAYPDNVKDFYREGTTWNHSISASTGNDKSNMTIAVGRTDQAGIIKYSNYSRTNFQFAAGTKLNNGLKISGTVTYTQSNQTGTTLGNGGSAFGQLTRIPRSFDLKNLGYTTVNGRSQYFTPGAMNPIWANENIQSNSTVDRISGNLKLDYDVTKWFNIAYRLGVDTYTDRRKNYQAIGSSRATTGQVIEDLLYRNEINSDLILTFKKDDLFLEGFNVNFLLGQNINQRKTQNPTIIGDNLGVPGFFNTSGASVFTNGTSESSSLRRLIGYYAQLSLSYKDFLFAEFTGRIDQSSTLPKSNNTFFYPSASISFVFTELLKINPLILSYGKVRASIATVGKDADPYLLQSLYVNAGYGNNLASASFPFNGTPGFQPSGRIGNDQIKPEFTTQQEIGLNLGFLNNRLSVDFAYFYGISKDQILNVAVPSTSGFSSRTLNVGELRNEGVELLVSGNPVKVGGFRWDVSLNYTRIRNKVLSIYPGVTQFAIPGNGFIGITPSIVEGQPYGVIVSSKFRRNADGQIIINGATGVPLANDAGQVVSDPNPDWTGGITNTFSYKGITLSFLFDTQQGGQLYSFSAQDLKAGGHLYQTGIDRDKSYIFPGVILNIDGTTYRPNNIQITSQTYWGQLGGLASEAAVYDATRYSLRELTLGYKLPTKWLTKTPFGEVSFSIVGRNLWFYAPGFPMDPEVNTQGAGNIRGMDLNGPPNTRNYGFNLKVTL